VVISDASKTLHNKEKGIIPDYLNLVTVLFVLHEPFIRMILDNFEMNVFRAPKDTPRTRNCWV
jgi:hypothetical protein